MSSRVPPSPPVRPLVDEVLPLAGVALAVMLLHLVCIGQYGLFRDEFYYLACGRHLAWGYVDHPPVVAVMAWLSTSLLGDSPLAIRSLPLLLSAVLVFLVGGVARRLGGGRLAQCGAAALVSLGPHFLFVFHILSMNCAEVVLWATGGWLVLVALQDGRRWAWVAFGVTAGIGLLTKHSMGVFGLGVFVGLLATHARRDLRTVWPWLGGVVALVLVLPHVWWQVANGWPTREFIANAQKYKIAEQSLGSFAGSLFGMVGPAGALLCVAGFWWLFRGRAGVAGRVLGVTASVCVLVFAVQKAKPYYATPALPMVVAAGAVWLERALERRPRLAGLAFAVLVAVALPIVPMGLPVLPVERYIAYATALGARADSGERHETGALPQHFADMHGWEDLARQVSAAFDTLPEEERATARVLARNYGEAGALEYYAGRYPLPAVIAAHNSYWMWGPGPDGGTLIVIGGRREEVERAFERVDEAGRTSCGYCMPYENGRAIWVARGWKIPLHVAWPREKSFI